ncbi:MAG: alpha/beta hydrolase [Phycisphaerales bacterium]|nr:MAG: alpha/beta hydrolase [Phycisphaerales bacterium]
MKHFRNAAFLVGLAIMLAISAGCSQMKTGPGQVQAEDGVKVAYDVCGSGKPALVFIHCWCCNREFWKHQLDVFADDYRVVAIDLPGHGESGNEREQWSIAGLGADVKTVVDHLRLRRMIVIGHSMGGPVALEAARLMPGRVLGIVAVDTLHDADFEYPKGMVEQWASQMETDFEGTMDGAVNSMFPEGADPRQMEWVKAQALLTDRTAAVALLRDFPNFDMKDSLRAAGAPVRAIFAVPWGPGSAKPNIEANRKYADFEAVSIDDVGHYLQLEKPEEFNEQLRGFVEALAG